MQLSNQVTPPRRGPRPAGAPLPRQWEQPAIGARFREDAVAAPVCREGRRGRDAVERDGLSFSGTVGEGSSNGTRSLALTMRVTRFLLPSLALILACAQRSAVERPAEADAKIVEFLADAVPRLAENKKFNGVVLYARDEAV